MYLLILLIVLYKCTTKDDNSSVDKDQELLLNVPQDPCFNPEEEDCEELEHFVERSVYVPGYCYVVATYKVYKCNGIITIGNLQWHFNEYHAECDDWAGELYQRCFNGCTMNGTQPPRPRNCIRECVGAALNKAEIDLFWFLIDDYVINHVDLSSLKSCSEIMNGSSDSDDNDGNVGRVRFFREVCKLVCSKSKRPYISIYDIVTYICGGGCCEQGATYCLDEDGNLTLTNFYSDATEVRCSEVENLCEKLYNQQTVTECRPATCN